MNYFETEITAERYANSRPPFHRNTLKRIKNILQINNKVSKALDIACGTGLSTETLLEIAENVFGSDMSYEMLKHAKQKDKINYRIAPAENQPFGDREFDLITVCSGLHWFDISKFLEEAIRLLKNGGWLVLYDNFFISEIENKAEFKNWFPEVYLKKFPSPPRNNDYNWDNDNNVKNNFKFIIEEEFKNPITFSKSQLINYFTTQSNITAAVESGKINYVNAEKWLDVELSPYFDKKDEQKTIYFGNWLKILQKSKS